MLKITVINFSKFNIRNVLISLLLFCHVSHCLWFFFLDSILLWQISDAYFTSICSSKSVSVSCSSEMPFFPLKDVRNTVTCPKMLRPQLSNLLLVQTLFSLLWQLPFVNDNNKCKTYLHSLFKKPMNELEYLYKFKLHGFLRDKCYRYQSANNY